MITSDKIAQDSMARRNTEKVTFTCPPELKNELEIFAENERRTLSNLVEGIVADWVALQKRKQEKSNQPKQDD
ncbi:hypothetical protein [Leptolyngbya sp. NIES-2104]|uniref:hypothetical protein n=1 Tax=Leptolyngbya sp. NIES-2104 TaxID=1552121 RepID=UPI0006ECA191|nr:hypothetical protein [Leptolyngbya sp. NIES-2104]GAP96096.1 hypothetical protein NIES2104_26310 [Leptolyngbya sp. NIES-2104]